MSDVEDNNDDDILDSWEEAADSGVLERRMEEHEKLLTKEEAEEMALYNSLNNGPVKILKAENSSKTEYTPQIKILKRAGLEDLNLNKPKNKTEAEMKVTLRLREAEYQAARDRILGVDYDESKQQQKVETDNTKISIIQNPSRNSPAGSPVTTKSRIISPKENKQPRSPNEFGSKGAKR